MKLKIDIITNSNSIKKITESLLTLLSKYETTISNINLSKDKKSI